MHNNSYLLNEIYTKEIPYEFGTIMGLIITNKIIIKKMKGNDIDYFNWWMENQFENIIFNEIMNYPHYVKKYNYMLKDEFCFKSYIKPFREGFSETSRLSMQRKIK